MSWFFEKISKIDKPLSQLIKEKKKARTQINKIKNGKGEITNNTTEIQRIARSDYEQLYTKKFANLSEMNNSRKIIFQN